MQLDTFRFGTCGHIATTPTKITLTLISVFICIFCGLPGQAWAGGTWDTGAGQVLDDGTSSGKGPFERASITIGSTTIHYPVGIESIDSTFFVIGWGNGWGTGGGNEYPLYFDKMVSYGFVVAASHATVVRDPDVLASVQVAMDENANPASPLYQKLNAQFGVMGKSGGGIAASMAVQTPDAIAAVIIAASNTGVADPGLFVTGTEDFGKTPVRTGYEDASGPAIYAEEQDTNHGDLDVSSAAAELSASFMRHFLRGDPNTYDYIINPQAQSGNWAQYEVKNTVQRLVEEDMTWIGDFTTHSSGWQQPETLGWMWALRSSASDVWIYFDAFQDWFWTGENAFPWLWSPSLGWLYYAPDSVNPTFFYINESDKWVTGDDLFNSLNVTVTYPAPPSPRAIFFDGILRGADYWSSEPKILAAGVGFSDIVGLQSDVLGGTLTVIGLADLGQREGGSIVYGDCYREDVDNYIDIIIVGDEAAARNITFLEIPSLEGGYSPFTTQVDPAPLPTRKRPTLLPARSTWNPSS